MIRYFPTAGDKHGWAIDEDRRLIRRALDGAALESPLWRAGVVHSPFWMALSMHDPEVLRRRFVIAHADNPPFFYLTQPEFAAAQQTVDLWVARSREAMEQFAALGLPVVHVPYAIDESVFFPITDRAGLRAKHGIPRDAYVIGNFHRDSEGSDLNLPKLQKAPETMLAILRMVRDLGLHPHVLLAGPRRHWIRKALASEGIPFTFVGRKDVAGDDFGLNILSRDKLNELYNACDLYLVPSRWEGGPQSAMEAAAAGTKILSFPLGVARDILERDSVFDTPSQAASKIARDMRDGFLASTLDAQKARLLSSHTAAAMARGLRSIYEDLPRKMAAKRTRASSAPLMDFLRDGAWRFRRRRPRALPRAVRMAHEKNRDAFMDEAMSNLASILATCGVSVEGGTGDPVVSGQSAEQSKFRLLPPGGRDDFPADAACRIALSVQDAVNFKTSGNKSPVLVCPLVFRESGEIRRRLVVEESDVNASLGIWRSMIAGGVPVYPSGSAYYYQIFHGGVPHGKERTKEEALALAERDETALQSLARVPTARDAEKFWLKLLAQ